MAYWDTPWSGYTQCGTAMGFPASYLWNPCLWFSLTPAHSYSVGHSRLSCLQFMRSMYGFPDGRSRQLHGQPLTHFIQSAPWGKRKSHLQGPCLQMARSGHCQLRTTKTPTATGMETFCPLISNTLHHLAGSLSAMGVILQSLPLGLPMVQALYGFSAGSRA
jgi:hypothetical protein